jgi:hypothetical protein
MAVENRRERYRLAYPHSERPELLVTGRLLEVIECSESGLRYALPDHEPPPPLGCEVRGVVGFRGRASHAVDGVVHRVRSGLVAVRFTRASIPFATILAEQKYLRSHYHARTPDGRHLPST